MPARLLGVRVPRETPMARSSTPPLERYYPLDDVADALAVSVTTLRRHIADGRLVAVMVGGQIRVSASALEAYAAPVTTTVRRRAVSA